MLHWGEAGYQSDKSCLKCPPLTQKFEGTNPWEWTFEALPNEHLGPMDFLVHASILLMVQKSGEKPPVDMVIIPLFTTGFKKSQVVVFSSDF